ncbi:MAG: META domain-containing protein [Pseudomonadota bacterium]
MANLLGHVTFALIVAIGLAGSAKAAGEIAELDGVATLVEDAGDLPPDAVLEVDLIDITRKGEKGRVLSRMRFDPDDGAPISFTLHYDSRLIGSRGRYSLAARLIDGTEVLYRSAIITPVLMDGLDPNPEILMERVRPLSAGGSPVGLKWRVRRIDGVEPFGFTKSVLILDEGQRMSGNAGCNKFKGSYKIDGDRVNFGAPAMTRRGCTPPIMDREKGYLRALERTTRYERDGDILYLFDPNGLETMQLTAE